VNPLPERSNRKDGVPATTQLFPLSVTFHTPVDVSVIVAGGGGERPGRVLTF
jgi:hypothetical protein